MYARYLYNKTIVSVSVTIQMNINNPAKKVVTRQSDAL